MPFLFKKASSPKPTMTSRQTSFNLLSFKISSTSSVSAHPTVLPRPVFAPTSPINVHSSLKAPLLGAMTSTLKKKFRKLFKNQAVKAEHFVEPVSALKNEVTLVEKETTSSTPSTSIALHEAPVEKSTPSSSDEVSPLHLEMSRPMFLPGETSESHAPLSTPTETAPARVLVQKSASLSYSAKGLVSEARPGSSTLRNSRSSNTLPRIAEEDVESDFPNTTDSESSPSSTPSPTSSATSAQSNLVRINRSALSNSMRRQYDYDHPDISARRSRSRCTVGKDSITTVNPTTQGMRSYNLARDIVVEIGSNFHVVIYFIALFGYFTYWPQVAAVGWLVISAIANLIKGRHRIAQVWRRTYRWATPYLAKYFNQGCITAEDVAFSYVPAVLIFLAVCGAFGLWIQWAASVWLIAAVAAGPGFDGEWKRLGEMGDSFVGVVKAIYERVGATYGIESKEGEDAPPLAPPSIIVTSATFVSLASSVGEEEPAWR